MMVVRFTQEHLTLDDLQNALSAVETQAGAIKAGVILDFAAVNELVGAWSLHLAMIVYFARQLRKPIRAALPR